MVRGDVFSNSFAAKLLELTHQIPIYRFRDGFSSMRRNQETFAKVYDLLRQDKVVLIFSESFTILEKRLRPIQKGTARMAFGAYEKIGKEFPIIPIGVNYTQADRFRSEVSLIGGPIIPLMAYYEIYQVDKQKGILDLTEMVRASLDQLVIQVKDPEDDQLADKLFAINRPLSFYELHPTVLNSRAHFDSDQQTVQWLNGLTAEEKQSVVSQLTETISVNPVMWLPLKLVQWVGQLVNAPPALLTFYIQDRYVTARPFKGPIMVGGGFIIYVFYVLIAVIIFILLDQSWLIPLLGFPALGYLSLLIQDYFKYYTAKKQRENKLVFNLEESTS